MTHRPRRLPSQAKLQLYAAGWTVADFARYYRKSDSWCYRVLNGVRPAPTNFKFALSDFLQEPVEYLFADEERHGGEVAM